MGLSNSKPREVPVEFPSINAIFLFPILKLPSLALNEVLKSMLLKELFMFSMVSNKTKNIVKSVVKHKSYKLEICFYEPLYSHLYLSCGNTKPLKININESYVPKKWFSKTNDNIVRVAYDSQKNVETLWKDRIKGFEFFVAHICCIFNPDISFILNSDNESLNFKICNMINKQNITLINADVYSDDPSDNLFQKILEIPSKNLRLFSKPRSQWFQLSIVPLKFESICIHHALWTELDYFLNCKTVELKNTKFVTQDITTFLDKWRASVSYSTELLTIEMNSIDVTSIANALSLTPIKKANTRVNGYREFKDGHCYEIQRIDGKKAIIYRFNFCVTFETVLS